MAPTEAAYWLRFGATAEARQHLGEPIRRGILRALGAALPLGWVIEPFVRLGFFEEAWRVQRDELWWSWPSIDLLPAYLSLGSGHQPG